MIFGVSVFIMVGLILQGYRIAKITEDLIQIWQTQRIGFVISIFINVFTLYVFMIEYNGWFATGWGLIWINLVIWNRNVRYIPIIIIRYVIIIIPFTLIIDALLSDSIIDGLFKGMANNTVEEQLIPSSHFVNPHEVSSYYRGDGTFVDGYYRDGDGNTAVNLSEEEGGGYIRSNPGRNPSNN